MAKIINRSGVLEDLLYELRNHDITQFDSLDSILTFQSNWKKKINNYIEQMRSSLSQEKENLEYRLKKLKIDYVTETTKKRDELLEEKEDLTNKLAYYKNNETRNFIQKIKRFFKRRKMEKRKYILDNDFEYYVTYPYRKLKSQIENCRIDINYYKDNFKEIVEERSEQFIRRQNYIKSILDELKLQIIGAIGENKAIEELAKLPDTYYVINNYQLEFNPPIYNRSEKEHIFSIQVDHLIVGPSGVFLIETKYWSKESVKNINLHSPVKQIRRSSFALFVILNDAVKQINSLFSKHHWGTKKISVRNIILMISQKPKEEFQYVKVLSLNRIISYITYFEPIFSNEEVSDIISILESSSRTYF
ncbi:MAG: NERD domain-containing protein [Candidatus Heimdallarchaeota archaeon]